MNTAILAFTQAGEALADRLAAVPVLGPAPLRHDPGQQSARSFVEAQFATCDALVVVGAAAIAVRLVAPLLRDKAHDPAVLVFDEKGRFVIPILSGHLGGANALASQLAAELGAEAVITTATDVQGCFAIDNWSREQGCTIEDISRIKTMSSRLLAGRPVGLHSDFPIDGSLPAGLVATTGEIRPEVGICITCEKRLDPFAVTLRVIPKVLTLGVGCRRGIAPDLFERFVLDTLDRAGLAFSAIRRVASIDLKQDEACILAFCDKHGLEFQTFSADQLAEAEGTFQASGWVHQVTGVDNVCERSAVLASGQGQLILPKQARDGMTCAVAQEDWRCVF
jgi:cobalt-precorrin 5A hydrolase